VPPGLPGLRSHPWVRLLLLAQLVLARMAEDIPPPDRHRLAMIVRGSRGDPRRLTAADRGDLVAILRRVDLRRLGRDAVGLALAGRVLRR
jgi:hypothetical protein